jgi:hypothetical protein
VLPCDVRGGQARKVVPLDDIVKPSIFVSYAHEDEAIKSTFVKNLADQSLVAAAKFSGTLHSSKFGAEQDPRKQSDALHAPWRPRTRRKQPRCQSKC